MRNVWALMFIFCIVSSLVGCQLPRALTANDIDSSDGEVHVRLVQLIDGTQIDFRSDPDGYAIIRDSSIVQTMSDGKVRLIPLDSVELEGSTRYPTADEIAFRNLLIVGGIVGIMIWWIIARPFSLHT